jgi:5'-deoxynucleotidase YfbR-like HD superfamily hydrolase
MEGIIHFLFKVNKLKETVRTGWIIWRIKNPETIAEHIFRVSFLSYLLGWKKNYNIGRIIKTALSHDLCEVYAGDVTPLFYYQNLDIKRKKDREILMKGIRLTKEEKEKMSKIKFENEKKSLLKLIDQLDESIKHEILFRWLDYEKGISAEGRFTRQVDWIENLIQSLEYLGPKKSGKGWWEIAEEKIFDHLLLEFLKVIQIRYYRKRKALHSAKEKELRGILEFILKIGKLKRMERVCWKVLGIKKGESVAEHIFSTSLLAWIFGKEKKHLNQTKLLKMALVHEISAAIIGDTIPYLEKITWQKKENFKKWLRFLKEEKIKKFIKQYDKEKNAMEKLTLSLEPELRKEIVNLWEEYRKVSSAEANFLNQINVLAVLFQGIIYHKKYKINTDPLFEWAFERCDDPILLSFLEKLAKS